MSTDKPDDPTVDLSKEVPKTNPVMEQILERINSLAEDIAAFRIEMNQRLMAVEKAIHTLERKFDVFSIESTAIKASVLDVVNRLEEVERKAS